MIEVFAVGIPARNEAQRVVAAIDALGRAAVRSPSPVHLVVAADRCDDDTADLARRAMAAWGGPAFASSGVVVTDLGTAGAARRAACDAAFDAARRGGPAADRIWIATSDADSTVPPSWFVRMRRWSVRGADGVAGLVELADDDGLDVVAHERWRAHVDGEGTGVGHPHVHGANLGLHADYWLAAGGFADLAVGEDHELWRRAGRLGATLVATNDIVVRTSARTSGRTPGGLAGLLADFAAPEPAGSAQ